MDSLPLRHQWLHYSLMLLITCRQELCSSSIIFFIFSGVSQQRKLIGYARMLHEGRSRGTCARPRERRSFFFQFLFLQTGLGFFFEGVQTGLVEAVGTRWSCGTGWASGYLLGPWAPLSSCTTVFVKSNKIKRSNSKKKIQFFR